MLCSTTEEVGTPRIRMESWVVCAEADGASSDSSEATTDSDEADEEDEEDA